MEFDDKRARPAYLRRRTRIGKKLRSARHIAEEARRRNRHPIRHRPDDLIPNDNDDAPLYDDEEYDDNDIGGQDLFLDARDQLLDDAGLPIVEPILQEDPNVLSDDDDQEAFYDCPDVDDGDDTGVMRRDADDVIGRLQHPDNTLFVQASTDYAQKMRKRAGAAAVSVAEIATQTRAAIELRSLIRGQSRKIIELILIYGRYFFLTFDAS